MRDNSNYFEKASIMFAVVFLMCFWINPVNAYICGDIDDSGSEADISDLVFLANYMFKQGDPPPVICQADVNYTEIHFSADRKEVVTVNIGKVEDLLNHSRFFRISRSHLINTDYLVKADRKTKSCELYKDNEKFVIPAPPKQIRVLEQRIQLGEI